MFGVDIVFCISSLASNASLSLPFLHLHVHPVFEAKTIEEAGGGRGFPLHSLIYGFAA